jgi:hypothetical protein
LNAGGVSSNQIQSHKRTDGVTEIIYRKTLAPTSDPHDNEIFDDKVPLLLLPLLSRINLLKSRYDEGKNISNNHKIDKMVVKYVDQVAIKIPTWSIASPSQIYPI